MAWRLKHPFSVKCIDQRPYLTIDQEGYLVTKPQEGLMISLTKGKTYEVFEIERGGQYRLVDDTREDYLFPAYMFEPLEGQSLDEELQDRFPFRFGAKLKLCGVLLNDNALGKWYEFTLYPWPENRWKMTSYEESWAGFFEKFGSLGRQPTAEEVRHFAKELALQFGIEW